MLSSKVWYILHFGTISSNFQDTDVIITLNNITRTTSHNSLSLNTNSSNVTYIHNILNRRTKHVQPVIQESYPLELIQKEKKNYSKHTYSTNHFSMLGKQTKRKWKKKTPTKNGIIDQPVVLVLICRNRFHQPISPFDILPSSTATDHDTCESEDDHVALQWPMNGLRWKRMWLRCHRLAEHHVPMQTNRRLYYKRKTRKINTG